MKLQVKWYYYFSFWCVNSLSHQSAHFRWKFESCLIPVIKRSWEKKIYQRGGGDGPLLEYRAKKPKKKKSMQMIPYTLPKGERIWRLALSNEFRRPRVDTTTRIIQTELFGTWKQPSAGTGWPLTVHVFSSSSKMKVKNLLVSRKGGNLFEKKK